MFKEVVLDRYEVYYQLINLSYKFINILNYVKVSIVDENILFNS